MSYCTHQSAKSLLIESLRLPSVIFIHSPAWTNLRALYTTRLFGPRKTSTWKTRAVILLVPGPRAYRSRRSGGPRPATSRSSSELPTWPCPCISAILLSRSRCVSSPTTQSCSGTGRLIMSASFTIVGGAMLFMTLPWSVSPSTRTFGRTAASSTGLPCRRITCSIPKPIKSRIIFGSRRPVLVLATLNKGTACVAGDAALLWYQTPVLGERLLRAVQLWVSAPVWHQEQPDHGVYRDLYDTRGRNSAWAWWCCFRNWICKFHSKRQQESTRTDIYRMVSLVSWPSSGWRASMVPSLRMNGFQEQRPTSASWSAATPTCSTYMARTAKRS